MKTMLITGAGSGIGAATARRFAKEGWQLGLFDINEQALEELRQDLGDRHWSKAVDVTAPAQVNAALQSFGLFSGGHLHLLFNSAGILRVGHFESLSMVEHAKIVQVNLLGLMQICHSAFPLLRVTPGARVINMSSATAFYGVPHFASYSASKFAVRGFTEALNLEWRQHDILVQDMMPPFVKTEMIHSQTVTSPIIDRLGVNLHADDVADAVYRAAQGTAVHNPVSKQFRSLLFAGKLMPERLTRSLVGLLSNT